MSDIQFGGLQLDLLGMVDLNIPPTAILIGGVLIALAMLVYSVRGRRRATAAVSFSNVRLVTRAARSGRQRFRWVLTALRVLAVLLLTVAFARPRSGTEYTEVTSEGVDIMLCLDVSSSMQAEDFKPYNRLYVAKEEIKNFVDRRVSDRIGLVVFARHSYTQCPLTTDYSVLLDFVDLVDFGVIEDGTAIGMAIANAVNRLRETEAKSKIIILLTDGDNNAGEIDPITAASLAEAFKIKIYTIGAGKTGNAMYPYNDPVFGKRYVYQPTKIDEATLKEIAKVTGGRYFRARSGEELHKIYGLIDELEKTEIKTASHVEYTELFQQFAMPGLVLVLLELLLGMTVLRRLP